MKGKFVRIKAGKEKLEHDEGTGCYKCPEPYRDGRAPSGGRRTKEFFFDPRVNSFRLKKEAVKYEETCPALFGKDKFHLPVHAYSITIALKKGDIPQGWWHRFIEHFAHRFAEKCQVGGERGRQKKNFHMQILVEMHSARDQNAVLEDKGGVSSSENKEGGVAKAVSL